MSDQLKPEMAPTPEQRAFAVYREAYKRGIAFLMEPPDSWDELPAPDQAAFKEIAEATFPRHFVAESGDKAQEALGSMTAMSIFPDGDGMGKDMLEGHDVIETKGMCRIGRLPHGMSSGASSVMLLVPLPTGHIVMVQWSWALFQTAYNALRVREEMRVEAEQGKR